MHSPAKNIKKTGDGNSTVKRRVIDLQYAKMSGVDNAVMH